MPRNVLIAFISLLSADALKIADTPTDSKIGSISLASLEYQLNRLRATSPNSRNFTNQKTTKKLAVFVSGLQDNLLLESKITNVIHVAALQGYRVDLYIAVVSSTGHPNEENIRVRNGLKSLDQESEEIIKSAIGHAGNLVTYNILDHQENVTAPAEYPPRMSEYSLAVKTNVVRKYFQYETLFNETLARNLDYDFVLVTRDNDHWLGPLNLSQFENYVNNSNTLFTKDCATYGGINDKTLLFGRTAAQAVLGQIYSRFYDTDPSFVTFTAEAFLRAFVRSRGVQSVAMEFHYLPTADSVYTVQESGQPYLCQKHLYLCPAAWQATPGYDRPDICK